MGSSRTTKQSNKKPSTRGKGISDGPYLYQVGYGSYEDSYFMEFKHDELMSEEDLERHVAECMAEAIRSSRKWYEYDLNMAASWIIIERLSNLMQKRGFKRIPYRATVSIFGWASPVNLNDWKGSRGDQDIRIVWAVADILKGRLWRCKGRMGAKSEAIIFAPNKEEAEKRAKKVLSTTKRSLRKILGFCQERLSKQDEQMQKAMAKGDVGEIRELQKSIKKEKKYEKSILNEIENPTPIKVTQFRQKRKK